MYLNIIYNESFLLKIDKKNNINKIKELIYEKINIPIELQTLQWSGKILDDNKNIKDYNIKNNDLVFLTNELKGGRVKGFPDIGHLVLLLGTSTIFLLLFYLFFDSIFKNIKFIPNENCGDITTINCSGVDISSSSGFLKKMSTAKGKASSGLSMMKNTKRKKGGNILQNTGFSFIEEKLYYISSIFYSALFIIIISLYIYSFICSNNLSDWIIIGALASLLIFFICSIILYKLKNIKIDNIIINFIKSDIILILSIITGILSLSLLGLTLIVPTIKKTKYLHWSTYLYPIGAVILYIISSYILKFNNIFLKVVIFLISMVILLFAPYIVAYIYNTSLLCH